MANPIGGRRNKSTVRGAAQLQPLEIDNSGLSRQGQHMLKRNNSKPQLQLPEIGGLRQDGERGDSRSQRLVSAKHAHLSPISQAALGVNSPQANHNMSPNKIQHIFDVIDRKSGKNLEKMQNDLTRIYMMQVNNKEGQGVQLPQDIKKRPDGEWGTLPANAVSPSAANMQSQQQLPASSGQYRTNVQP